MRGPGRVVVGPEQFAQVSPGRRSASTAGKDLDQRARLAGAPGRERHGLTVDKDLEPAEHVDGDGCWCGGPEGLTFDGRAPTCCRRRAASRARDLVMLSAPSRRPKWISIRHAEGSAPPWRQIPSASASAERASSASSVHAAASSSASARRSSAWLERAAATDSPACAAASARSPRASATQPSAVRANDASDGGASRQRLLGRGVRAVGRSLGEEPARARPAPGRAPAARWTRARAAPLRRTPSAPARGSPRRGGRRRAHTTRPRCDSGRAVG